MIHALRLLPQSMRAVRDHDRRNVFHTVQVPEVQSAAKCLNGDEAVLNTYSEPAALFVKLFVYG